MRTIDLLTPEEVCREIGVRCRALRLSHNFSQSDLATMTKSSLSSIRRLEAHGQGTLLLLAHVVQALHATHAFEPFLSPSIMHIADLERTTDSTQRQRASALRRRAVREHGTA